MSGENVKEAEVSGSADRKVSSTVKLGSSEGSWRFGWDLGGLVWVGEGSWVSSDGS